LLVEYVATPEARATVPIDAAPSKNVALPPGVPARLETAAVNVTVVPNGAGLADELSRVVVSGKSTVIVTALEVAPRKSASPPKLAVNVSLPEFGSAAEKVATPLSSDAVPSTLAPLKKVTIPAGVPVVVLSTVAVRVKGLPAGMDVALAARRTVTGARVTVNVPSWMVWVY
jgi:hypothetical protein